MPKEFKVEADVKTSTFDAARISDSVVIDLEEEIKQISGSKKSINKAA